MKDWLITLALTWLFQDGLKEVEKQNLTTKALEILYKQPDLKKNWKMVCQGISELLADASQEAQTAKGWTHA
jgi:hypothetical protein